MAAVDNINTAQHGGRPIIQLNPVSKQQPQGQTVQRPIIHLDNTYDHHWDESGQGMMFSPKVGTGLSDDPISRERRSELVSKIVDSDRTTAATYPDRLKRAHDLFNNSRIPLQHLSDIAHSGTRFTILSGRTSSGFSPSMNTIIMSADTHTDPVWLNNQKHVHDRGLTPDEQEEHAHVHEFGHAYHNTRMPFTNDATASANRHDTGLIKFNPYYEGIADGYTRRHMSKQFHSARAYAEYAQHIVNWEKRDMSDSAVHARNVYRNTRNYVASTGDVPFISTGAAFASPVLGRHRPASHDVPLPVEKHPQLPGMED